MKLKKKKSKGYSIDADFMEVYYLQKIAQYIAELKCMHSNPALFTLSDVAAHVEFMNNQAKNYQQMLNDIQDWDLDEILFKKEQKK